VKSARLVLSRFGTTGVAIVATLAIVSALVLSFGANPLVAAAAIWQGAAGSPFTIGQTLTIAGVLALTGLATLIPFTARLFNVGGEGQLVLGAIGSITVALQLGTNAWALPLSLVAGIASGVLWALIPGLLRGLLGASEMIVSLLLNFVAALLESYIISKVFPDETAQATRTIAPSAHLPVLWEAGAVNVGLVLVVIVVVLAWMLMTYTRLGFGIRAVGLGHRAARLAGFSDRATTVVTFAIGGGCAGLAGAILVLGTGGQLNAGISGGYGFLGVVVALLAGARTAWLPLAAILIAGLTVGSNQLQLAANIPFSLGIVVIGVLVLSLLATGVIKIRRS
jgi:ABC-type uncharacterized transport system permease subunit